MPGFPNSMSFNQNITEKGQEIVDLFTQYFSSIYNDTAPTNNNSQSNIVQSIYHLHIYVYNISIHFILNSLMFSMN